MDLANPSPALGWDSRERLSLRERGPADLVLALALIHHLVLSAYVPMPLIAQWFGGLGNQAMAQRLQSRDNQTA